VCVLTGIRAAGGRRGRAQNATEVVISGCSAGGLATILHTDHWRDRIVNASEQNGTAVSVVGMPDSGFFIEYDDFDKRFETGLRSVFNEFNVSATANAACMADHQGAMEEYKCIFAEVPPHPHPSSLLTSGVRGCANNAGGPRRGRVLGYHQLSQGSPHSFTPPAPTSRW
jgi:hypothetical protein